MSWLGRFFGREKVLRGPLVQGNSTTQPGTVPFYTERAAYIAQQEQMEVAQSWGAAVASGRVDPDAAQYALAQIRIAQRQLQLLKKDIRTSMTTLRGYGVSARQNKLKKLPRTGLYWTDLFSPPVSGRELRAQKRQQMRQQERQNISLYENVIATIDQTLLNFEREKARIEAWLTRNRHRH